MGFTRLRSLNLGNVLTGRLVPTADRLRDLGTRFGLRRCEVRIVRTRWTRGVRFKGEEEVITQAVLLPNPKVMDLGSLRFVNEPGGLMEDCQIEVREISGRYTEDFLRGLGEGGTAVPDDESVYYEIEFFQGGSSNVLRRFVLAGAPSYNPGALQWVVKLRRAQGERQRDGSTR